MKRYLKLFALIAWMILIFSFSAEPGDNSAQVSGQITTNIYSFLKLFSYLPMDISTFLLSYEGLIRKLAHIFLYLVLGILAYINFIEFKKNPIILSLVFCFLYACSDEFHQLFVLERSGNLIDVMIDSFGSLIGIYLCHLLKKICLKRQSKLFS